MVLLFAAFYFLLIRPQRKRQQEQLQMQSSLGVGTRVMTTTGLFATVVGFDGDDVVLEIAPGVETHWVKAAIGRVVPPADGADDADDSDEPEDEIGEVRPVSDETGAESGDNEDSSTKKS
ncbi:preprotein translocase subunit YajC [Streptosporangiaceae bacterium NEAU-GS5]|nr:preprotein translocase subunit YajC [Streptosporangiaceae bacterium NEAU-GS5]